MHNTSLPKIEIIPDLSPENAPGMGYAWHSDKIYIPEAPYEANVELYKWVNSGGVVGLAANPDFNDHAVGLYESIAENSLIKDKLDSKVK